MFSFKFLWLSVVTLLHADIIQSAVVPSKQFDGNSNRQFTILGSYTPPTPPKGRSRSSILSVTSYYFLSQNAAAYVTAAADCKASIDDTATLLSIETQEELANVTQFLRDSDDTGSTYWLGGKYDNPKSKFSWENGAEIGPWAPWDQGHPNTRTSLTRVFLRRVGGDIKFRTQFQTVSTRYICEYKIGQQEEEAEPCYNDNDLVIVVDSSGSIGLDNYAVALEFTTRLGIAWADNTRNRLGVIIYSTNVLPIFGLDRNLTVAEIRDQVYKAPYLNGNTASHLGLDRALHEFESNLRSVPKNMVFLTDGASNSRSQTEVAAQRVNGAGIRSYSVGIGHGINPSELLVIADGNSNHVFNTDGFDDLLKLLQPVSRRVCNK